MSLPFKYKGYSVFECMGNGKIVAILTPESKVIIAESENKARMIINSKIGLYKGKAGAEKVTE